MELEVVEQAQQTSNSPKDRSVNSGGSCKILLVEDHADTLRVMVRVLTKMGHTVTTASSVGGALEAATLGTFDLLICDLGLPDGSGIEVMKQLRSLHGTRGIAVSGFGQDEDLRRSKEGGFTTHLVKPLNLNALQEAIMQICPQ